MHPLKENPVSAQRLSLKILLARLSIINAEILVTITTAPSLGSYRYDDFLKHSCPKTATPLRGRLNAFPSATTRL